MIMLNEDREFGRVFQYVSLPPALSSFSSFFSFARAKEKNQKKSTADLMQNSSAAEQSSAKSAVRVRT
jgi:hypothetical protein